MAEPEANQEEPALSRNQIKEKYQKLVDQNKLVLLLDDEAKRGALGFLKKHRGKIPAGVKSPSSPAWLYCKRVYDVDPADPEKDTKLQGLKPRSDVVWVPSPNLTRFPNGRILLYSNLIALFPFPHQIL